jgi:Spy/CpxP family protein refolding chaperone
MLRGKEALMLAKAKMLGLMLATAVVLTSPMLVYADSSHQAGDSHHDQQDHMMFKILNLSEDQKKQLKDSRKKQMKAMNSILEQMKSNREEFNAEIVKARLDMNKIKNNQAHLKSIQSQIVDNHLDSILEIKKIMTPEQFAGYMALENEKKLKKHDGQKNRNHHTD